MDTVITTPLRRFLHVRELLHQEKYGSVSVGANAEEENSSILILSRDNGNDKALLTRVDFILFY